MADGYRCLYALCYITLLLEVIPDVVQLGTVVPLHGEIPLSKMEALSVTESTSHLSHRPSDY